MLLLYFSGKSSLGTLFSIYCKFILKIAGIFQNFNCRYPYVVFLYNTCTEFMHLKISPVKQQKLLHQQQYVLTLYHKKCIQALVISPPSRRCLHNYSAVAYSHMYRAIEQTSNVNESLFNATT